MRTFFLLILIFPLTAHSFTSYKPFQDVDPNNKEKFIAHKFTGKYLDCGTMKGYINSTLEISKI